MKIRTDFVTNSSSSSFTVRLKIDLTDGSVCKLSASGYEFMDAPDPEYFSLLDEAGKIAFGTSIYLDECVCDDPCEDEEHEDEACEEGEKPDAAYPRSLSHILETKEGLVKSVFWSVGAKESVSCKYNRESLLECMSNMEDCLKKGNDIVGARLYICFNRDCDGENHSCQGILKHIFTEKQAELIYELCQIEDDALVTDMLKKLTVLDRYTESSIPELINFCRNYDYENACQLFMNQFLCPDGLVYLRFNWDNDPRDFEFDYYDTDWWE